MSTARGRSSTSSPSSSLPSSHQQRDIIIRPQPGPQVKFLACQADIVVFGGAAGGGKSYALLLDALRYAALAPVPNFGAVIFRRTSPQITATGGLWEQSGKLYPLAGGKPNQSRLEWRWVEHKTHIRFSHLQYDSNVYNWQGSEVAYIGFDELTHFAEATFFYMLSRNRSTCGVKPRVRATTNPDADSWVKRFLAPWVDETYPDPAESGEIRYFYRDGDQVIWMRQRRDAPSHIMPEQVKSATFIAAKITDNPALLRSNPDYLANLMALPLVERQRLLYGDWSIRPSGNKFKRHWFEIVDAAPAELERVVRRWDMAATEPKPGRDPDWTAGVKMGRARNGVYYVLDLVHERLSPKGNEDVVLATTASDGASVAVRMEQEPGSSGKAIADRYRRLLAGHDYRAVRASGNKEMRANPLSAQAEAGNIKLVRGYWNDAFLNELCAFPMIGVHDDIVDAAAGAFDDLTGDSLATELQRRLELRRERLAQTPSPTSAPRTLAHPEQTTPPTPDVAPDLTPTPTPSLPSPPSPTPSVAPPPTSDFSWPF